MKKTKGVEILDAKESVKTSPQKVASSTTAVVPYKTNVPALLPSLGNLDAYIRTVNTAPILSPKEEHDLAVQLRDKNDLVAAQRLIVSHLRLVVSIARGYLGYGLPHADLIQEGNIGLMKAIKHFDPDRGVRLMTFAVHWIRSEIQEYIIRNWRMVKIATTKNQRKLFFNLRQLKEDNKNLTAEKARAIASELEVKPSEVLEMDTRLTGNDASIDYTDEENENTAPIDYLTDESATPEVEVETKETALFARESLRKALRQLEPRERRVIQARWLTENKEGEVAPLTLQDLAAELNVSAERVRQIEKSAIASMRKILIDQK